MVIPTFDEESLLGFARWIHAWKKTSKQNILPNGGAFDGNEPHGIPIR